MLKRKQMNITEEIDQESERFRHGGVLRTPRDRRRGAARVPRDLTFMLQEEEVDLIEIENACYREPPNLLLELWNREKHNLHEDVRSAIIKGVSGAVARDCYADFQLNPFLECPDFYQAILTGFKELWCGLRFSVGHTTLWIDSSKGKKHNCSKEEKEKLLHHCLNRSSVTIRIGNQQKDVCIWLSPKASKIIRRSHQFELVLTQESSVHQND